MEIVIPTYRRPTMQRTWNALNDYWRARTMFVVDRKDCDDMEDVYDGAHYLVVPPTVKTIAQKRAWILSQKSFKHIVMFDDDLRFAVRKNKTDSSLRPAMPEDVSMYLHALANKLAGGYAHAGFDMRFGNNGKPHGWRENTRMVYSLAYNCEIVRDVCKLGRIETREDFDYTLQLLRAGHPNTVCSSITCDQTFNAPGGCSERGQRTMERSNADALKLAKLHPGLVTVVKKEYASSIPRLEVRVQWKKALGAG